MFEPKKSYETDDYDTTINIVGGLKDCSIIYKAIDGFFARNDSAESLVSRASGFNLRTEKSRSRIELAVRRAFLTFKDTDHRALIGSFFKSRAALTDRELVLFWQLAINNRLFREISQNVFFKIYFSGRVGISKDDIIAWLKEFLTKNKSLPFKWSESTIDTLATKYLNLMTKLNLIEGSRKKVFKHIRPSAESLVIFMYFAQLYRPYEGNLLTNDFLPLSFVAPGDIRDRLKKLTLKGLLNLAFNGTALNFELIHDYKGICDVLYH